MERSLSASKGLVGRLREKAFKKKNHVMIYDIPLSLIPLEKYWEDKYNQGYYYSPNHIVPDLFETVRNDNSTRFELYGLAKKDENGKYTQMFPAYNPYINAYELENHILISTGYGLYEYIKGQMTTLIDYIGVAAYPIEEDVHVWVQDRYPRENYITRWGNECHASVYELAKDPNSEGFIVNTRSSQFGPVAYKTYHRIGKKE